MKQLAIPAWTIAAATLFFSSSCNDTTDSTPENQTQDSMTTKSNPGIQQENYGSVDGQDITRFTLTNASGMVVKIINYGGTITNVIVPDSAGNPGDVVLGFDSLSGYTQAKNPFFGCLVGRYGNRIAKGQFTLDGKKYQIGTNDHGHALHGGIVGFNRKVWEAVPLPGDSSLQLSYTSKDGEEGFPGTLQVKVVYSLTSANEIKIDYSATTDQATPVNLTNHTYFNLSGGRDSTILGHMVTIHADRYTPVDKTLIPTGELAPVNGTAMDFKVPSRIGDRIDKVEGGYDHNWVLNKKNNPGPEFAVSVNDPNSGRMLEMFTTEPGVQFYTGNFLDGSLIGKNGMKYVRNGGFCLEAQHFPDSPNRPAFPSTILKPGDTYRQTTIYKFSAKS